MAVNLLSRIALRRAPSPLPLVATFRPGGGGDFSFDGGPVPDSRRRRRSINVRDAVTNSLSGFSTKEYCPADGAVVALYVTR